MLLNMLRCADGKSNMLYIETHSHTQIQVLLHSAVTVWIKATFPSILILKVERGSQVQIFFVVSSGWFFLFTQTILIHQNHELHVTSRKAISGLRVKIFTVVSFHITLLPACVPPPVLLALISLTRSLLVLTPLC